MPNPFKSLAKAAGGAMGGAGKTMAGGMGAGMKPPPPARPAVAKIAKISKSIKKPMGAAPPPVDMAPQPPAQQPLRPQTGGGWGAAIGGLGAGMGGMMKPQVMPQMQQMMQKPMQIPPNMPMGMAGPAMQQAPGMGGIGGMMGGMARPGMIGGGVTGMGGMGGMKGKMDPRQMMMQRKNQNLQKQQMANQEAPGMAARMAMPASPMGGGGWTFGM